MRYQVPIFAVIITAACSITWAVNTKMIPVKGGTFHMGSDHYTARDPEKPVHEVTVGSFYMSRYEVTFAEFDRYCKDTGRSKPHDWGRGRGNKPVSSVNWFDAVSYCNWLSKKEGLTPCYSQKNKKVLCNFEADGYRLPTEAEWEYAARGGQNKENFQYAGSDNHKSVSWNRYNSKGSPHTVGTKKPNSLGLYDMTGNISEWCWDYCDKKYYSVSPRKDPTGPEASIYRVQRGGDYGASPYLCRVTMRGAVGGGTINGNSGFRVVRSMR